MQQYCTVLYVITIRVILSVDPWSSWGSSSGGLGACPSDVHSSTRVQYSTVFVLSIDRDIDPGRDGSLAVDGQNLNLEASSFSMSARLA
jgi:hypothetical protein